MPVRLTLLLAWEKTRLGKIYAADNGLISYFSGRTDSEEGLGRRLENLVFCQLRSRRNELDYEVYYHKTPSYEIDFVIDRLRRPVRLVQVAYDFSSPKTRERELSALFAAGQALNCPDLVLVTDHENGEEVRGGLRVRIADAPTWLLENDQERPSAD